METVDGLKYWLVKHGPKLGLQRSILTEDETVSMHAYGGNREDGGSYLFCFKGFQIGFALYEINNRPFPQPDGVAEIDKEGKHTLYTVSAIGIPVWDEHATMKLDKHGGYLRDKYGGYVIDMSARKADIGFVTGLTWKQYHKGKFDRFQSRSQQETMLSMWADLFCGLRGNLSRYYRSAEGWKIKMRFSDDIEKN